MNSIWRTALITARSLKWCYITELHYMSVLTFTLFSLNTAITMEIPLACRSKLELRAVIHYFMGTGNTATEIYSKLVSIWQ